MRRWTCLLGAALCAVFMVGLADEESSGGWSPSSEARLRVVAYVEREVITADELQYHVLASAEGRHLNRVFQGEELARRWRHLEKRKLNELITRKLFALEARRRSPPLDRETREQAIAHELEQRGLKDRDELRAQLRGQGLSWEEFLKEIEDMILIDRYESWVTRRMRLVPPEAVQEFYEKHKDEAFIEHRSVDGHQRRVRLRTPDRVRVNQIILQPDLEKVSDVAQLAEVQDALYRIVQGYEGGTVADVETWIQQAREAVPLAKIDWLPHESHEEEVLGELAAAARHAEPGTWLPPQRTFEPTFDRRVRIERWDLVQVLAREPGGCLPFRDVREAIERYLQDSVRDQEIKLAQERLWKLGSVRIVGEGN